MAKRWTMPHRRASAPHSATDGAAPTPTSYPDVGRRAGPVRAVEPYGTCATDEGRGVDVAEREQAIAGLSGPRRMPLRP